VNKNQPLGDILALASLEDKWKTNKEQGSTTATVAIPWAATIGQNSETVCSGLGNKNYTISTAMPAVAYNAAQVTQPTAGSSWGVTEF
jgi:hypothetical protein